MDPILLKKSLSTQDVDLLIKQGLNDMEISLDQKESIYSAAGILTFKFVDIISFHTKNNKLNDASYSFN